MTQKVLMFRTLPATLAVLMCPWLPAARADIFVSSLDGTPPPYMLYGAVYSYDQYTGSPKMTFRGPLQFATGVTIGPDGNLYVADCGTSLNSSDVVRFNPSTGAYIGVFATMNPPACAFGITFGPDGNLYVANNIGNIQKFNGSTGALMLQYPCSNPATGAACYPVDLTFGPDNNLYVSDTVSGGVLKFNGSTLVWMGQFVTGYPGGFPEGLHFDPNNGNLYLLISMPIPKTSNYYNDIFEYNGSTGSPISFSIPYPPVGEDFAFGQDGEIYIPGDLSFTRLSASTGAVFATFGSTGFTDSYITPTFMAIGGAPPPCCSNLPPVLHGLALGLDSTQTLRLTVVNGPVPVGPGVPVEAQLGFQNSSGQPVGPSQMVTLNPGQTASLDLPASSLISSGRIELVPVVQAPAGAPPASLQGSAEIYTPTYGFGSVLSVALPAASGITGFPSFAPQGVALGQSIQINALAPADSPCVAELSFTDNNGNAIGPTQQVNLSPGTAASLTFNPNRYTKTGRQEYVPHLTPINTINPNGAQVNSACLGSAEVFIQKTGAISTYQVSSPPLGTTTAVP